MVGGLFLYGCDHHSSQLLMRRLRSLALASNNLRVNSERNNLRVPGYTAVVKNKKNKFIEFAGWTVIKSKLSTRLRGTGPANLGTTDQPF